MVNVELLRLLSCVRVKIQHHLEHENNIGNSKRGLPAVGLLL